MIVMLTIKLYRHYHDIRVRSHREETHDRIVVNEEAGVMDELIQEILREQQEQEAQQIQEHFDNLIEDIINRILSRTPIINISPVREDIKGIDIEEETPI
jgi:tetrahydromethanopterin S-methyltransferase subunit B